MLPTFFFRLLLSLACCSFLLLQFALQRAFFFSQSASCSCLLLLLLPSSFLALALAFASSSSSSSSSSCLLASCSCRLLSSSLSCFRLLSLGAWILLQRLACSCRLLSSFVSFFLLSLVSCLVSCFFFFCLACFLLVQLACFLLAFFLCLLGILCFRLLLSLDFASTLAACNLFFDTLPLLSTGVGGCFQEMDEGPRRKGTFFRETLYSLNGSMLHTMVSCEQIPWPKLNQPRRNRGQDREHRCRLGDQWPCNVFPLAELATRPVVWF